MALISKINRKREVSLKTENSKLINSVLTLSHNDIKEAFSSSQFCLVFQPKISLSDPHCLLGAEVFVRLKHSSGILPPESFLPVITEMDLKLDLALEVVKQATFHWESLQQAGYKIQLSINIDQSLFKDLSLAGKLAEVISKSKMPKRHLTLEISNTHISEVTPIEREQIIRLRMKGFRIAIDNCGHADLNKEQILELPLDELKLQRQLVSELMLSSGARAKASQIKNIADCLGIPLVAVGIETAEQADWLKRLGCESAQGFLYGPPVPADCLEMFLVKMHQWQMPDIAEKLHILLVHDDSTFSERLSEGLTDNYRVTATQTLADAKHLFSIYRPEILMLKYQVEDGSCLEFCEGLHASNDGSFCSIFIADKNTDDAQLRIQAYNAGASDTLHENISVDEIFAKVQRVASLHSQRKKLQAEAEEMQKVALGSMTEASHYGDVLQFMKKLLTCDDEASMAKQVFQLMRSKNLSCAVQFRSPDSEICFNEGGSFGTPLELNMFEMLYNKGRLYEFNNQTIVNDQHVSILIKNMPSNKEEIGRIRDYIAVVIEGLEARYQDTLRKQTLNSMFDRLSVMAGGLSDDIISEQQNKKQMVEQLNIDLQMSFHLLDLNEDQEMHITKIVESLLASYDESEEAAITTCEGVKGLVNLLSRTITSLDKETKEEPQESPGELDELWD